MIFFPAARKRISGVIWGGGVAEEEERGCHLLEKGEQMVFLCSMEEGAWRSGGDVLLCTQCVAKVT